MIAIPDFLKPLEFFSSSLPRDTIEAAIAQKETCLPVFIEVVTHIAQDYRDGKIPDEYALHTYALHILAEWRETQAYRPIIELAREREVDALLDDAINEDLPSLIAATWDGNFEPIYSLIADEAADEFARGAGVTALGCLHVGGKIDRTTLYDTCLHVHKHCLGFRGSEAWDSWVMLVSDFGFTAFEEHIRKAYKQGQADLFFQDKEDAIKALHAWSEDDPNPLGEYKAYSSVIETLSGWYCFSEEAIQEDIQESTSAKDRVLDMLRNEKIMEALRTDHDFEEEAMPETYVRSEPKIGRNDPCPCGSGKKYKKCCL